MDKELTVTNEGQLREIENTIFDTVLVENHYLHILKLNHSCTGEYRDLLKNNHPIIKIIRISPRILPELVALRDVLRSHKGDLYTFVPRVELQLLMNK